MEEIWLNKLILIRTEQHYSLYTINCGEMCQDILDHVIWLWIEQFPVSHWSLQWSNSSAAVKLCSLRGQSEISGRIFKTSLPGNQQVTWSSLSTWGANGEGFWISLLCCITNHPQAQLHSHESLRKQNSSRRALTHSA